MTQQDGRTLLADLRRLKATPAQKALVKQLETTDAEHRHTLLRNESRTLTDVARDAARAEADAARVNRHPADAVLQTDLTAALAALQAAAAANTVPADATQCHLGVDGSLAPIAAVDVHDPKLQSDVGAAQSGSDNIGQILQAPMATVLAIVAQFESDATTG